MLVSLHDINVELVDLIIYFNNGIGTYLGLTTGFASGLGIHSVYANTGIFTAVQIQGSNIADSANFDRAVIGILTVTEDISLVLIKRILAFLPSEPQPSMVWVKPFHMTGDA